MFKVIVCDENEAIKRQMILEFEEEYQLDTETKRIEIGEKINDMILSIINDQNNFNVFKGKENIYYHHNILFYITSILLGLVFLFEAYNSDFISDSLENVLYLIIGLIFFSFIGALVIAATQPVSNIIVFDFIQKKGNQIPPPRSVILLSNVLIISISFIIIKIIAFVS